MRYHRDTENFNSDYDPNLDYSEDISDDRKHSRESSKADRHRIEVRRAIEERLERIRLQQELDYLFDDEFPEKDEK